MKWGYRPLLEENQNYVLNLLSNNQENLLKGQRLFCYAYMYDGSYGSIYDEYSQQSKYKREIPKSNKGYHWKHQSQYYSLQNHKQDK